MTHQEVWKNEVYQSYSELLWLNFCKEVEAKLGHSLDGDEHKDGYSLDGAYDCFRRGFKANEYVKMVRYQKDKNLPVS